MSVSLRELKMAHKWTAKGETTTTLIMWIGSLLSVIISVIWMSKNLSVQHITIENVDFEMSSIQGALSTACNMDYYRYKYNPKLNEGKLIIENYSLCIDSSPCKSVYYSSANEPKTEGVRIVIEDAVKCNIPQNCKALYYTGNNEPYSGNSTNPTIIIEDVSECKKNSITRCRLLLCNTNTTAMINFKNITYVTIKKNESFDISAE